MLLVFSNMLIQDNKLIHDAQEVLRVRLPKGWQTNLDESGAATGDAPADVRLEVRGPDGRATSLAVHVRRSLQPRGALELRTRLQDVAMEEPTLVVAPYLSPAVRERLTEVGMGFLDLTGNVRIALTSPGLFIDASGADVNPDRQSRASRSLRGGKAGRIVRALIDRKEPPGVRGLAKITGANPGYVSRTVALLDRQALIERSGRGRIVSVDWPRLLERWAQDAPLSSRGTQTTCLDPRGLSAMTSRLSKSTLRYAVTGTLAVSELAPVAAGRLAVVYADDVGKAVSALELRVAERGANVVLIEPEDEGVFEGSTVRNGLRVVAVSQAAADLLTSPGRGPAEAEALIAWMGDNEEVWRG
jgi:hypothetical protein